MQPKTNTIKLSWARQDIEQRLGIPGGKLTRVNSWFSAILAVTVTLCIVGLLLLMKDTYISQMFLVRGMFVPYSIIFFTSWSFVILFVKWRKIAFQRKALRYAVVPQDSDFVLSSTTVEDVLQNIYLTVDNPKHFTLFNRIVVSLTNLRNLGRVSDVDEILRSQAEHDESAMETSYAMLRSFVWAIPVLGFIGTVLGLSQAIGGFGEVLKTTDDLSNIKDALQSVTGGLATAFETTLQALVAALAIQLCLAFLKKSEEEFLDECREYCARHVVNRLRIMPFQNTGEN